MKAKKILYGIAMAFLCLLNLPVILLGISVLGKKESVFTQLGTIFFPMLAAYFFVLIIVLLIVEALAMWKSRKKFLIALTAVSACIFVLLAVELGRYSAAVKANGGSVSLFKALTASVNAINDEQIVYATKDGEDLTISIYNTAGRAEDELRPVYVYIHGGGWGSGTSEDQAALHRMMADHGYVGFSINYRLCNVGNLGNPTWDKAIYDCNEAMKWIYEHAKEYGGDPDRMFLSGESAGGNLSLVYAGRVSTGDLDGPLPQAVCVLYPAIDLKQIVENGRFLTADVIPYIVEPYIGGELNEYPERWEAITPLSWISDKMPPVLIIHGEKDTLVPIDGSKLYAERLNEVGGDATLAPIPYSNHGIGNQANTTIIWNYLKQIDGLSVQ